MGEFVMPALGADMRTGILVDWLKKPGDRVARGDLIAEVETDKGVIEVEVFETGIVDELLVEVGARVPVGTPLAIIREESGAGVPSPAPVATVSAPAAPEDRVRVTPAARRLARELGVDVSTLAGTRRTIHLQDVRAAASEPEPEQEATASGESAARMRVAIAAAMARSKREIPHYYVSTAVDLSAAHGFLEHENAERSPARRLVAGIVFVKATARALRDFPDLNGRWEGDQVVHNPAVHVGMAISLRGGGLIAPALQDADGKSLDALMGEFRDLVTRARRGQLRSSELTDPTVTVTSMGERGVETVYGIINPPQVAIVGFGKVVRRPWAVGDALAVRPVVHIALSADHRVSDGHQGALFLSRIDELLQNPEAL